MMSQDEWAIRSRWISEDNAHEDAMWERSHEEQRVDALERENQELRAKVAMLESRMRDAGLLDFDGLPF
jgi:hypothetical protein